MDGTGRQGASHSPGRAETRCPELPVGAAETTRFPRAVTADLASYRRGPGNPARPGGCRQAPPRPSGRGRYR